MPSNPTKSRQIYILGADPGLSGAIAWYNTSTKTIDHVHDMPTVQINNKVHLDLPRLANLVNAYSRDTILAVIEEPSAMPGQGVVSTFRFGHACGVIQGVVSGSNVPIQFVRPAIWKQILGLSRDKNRSRIMATQMFPGQVHQFLRKKDDGRAEASLLAFFGERFLLGYKPNKSN